MPRNGGSAAFFDVDETLISVKSVFRFLAFHFGRSDRPPSAFDAAYRRIRTISGSRGRESGLRAYFRLYTNEPVDRIAERGNRWFEDEMTGSLFHQPVLQELREHAGRGRQIVLVSGSFPACLDPIARHIGADAVLCCRPEIRDGRYTGAIAQPLVGPAKSARIAEFAREADIDLRNSYAYGDHGSDLPMLSMVGNPVIVGDAPDLLTAGVGWRRLPGVPARNNISRPASKKTITPTSGGPT